MSGDRVQMNSQRWRQIGSRDADDVVGYLDRAAQLLHANRLETVRLLDPPHGCSMLDVGCGPGDLLIALSDNRPDIRATGIDLSPALIHTARRRADPQTPFPLFHVGDVEQLAYPNQTFDRVNCERLLVHVRHPRHALTEIVRVLTPGGRIVLSEPDFDAFMTDSDDLDVATAVRTALIRGLQNPDIGRQLRRLAIDAGLTVDEITVTGVPITRLQDAINQFQLFDVLARATETSLIDAQKAHRWRTEIQALDNADAFLVVPIMFRLVATKPLDGTT